MLRVLALGIGLALWCAACGGTSNEPEVGLGDPTPSLSDDREFVWHNGATGGYASFIGFDAEAGEGIVILSNSQISVDNLAYRLFTRDFGEWSG